VIDYSTRRRFRQPDPIGQYGHPFDCLPTSQGQAVIEPVYDKLRRHSPELFGHNRLPESLPLSPSRT